MSGFALSPAVAVAALLLTVARRDSSTEPAPVPAATLTIAPLSSAVYETDFVQFSAVLRDASGQPVPGATIAWEVSVPTRAEHEGHGGIMALKAARLALRPAATAPRRTTTSTSPGWSCSGWRCCRSDWSLARATSRQWA